MSKLQKIKVGEKKVTIRMNQSSIYAGKYGTNKDLTLNDEYFDFIHLFNTYKRYVKSEHTVIEVGASTKSRTKYLSTYCNKLIAVEYFPDRLPKNFNNVYYIQGDWQRLSKYVNEPVDILVSSHCIEHIYDDLTAINETYSVLKDGGIAIINTPNRLRLVRSIIELFTGPRKFPYWEHFREYTKQDLINLIKRSKFKKYTIEPICFGISPARFQCIKKCPSFLEKYCIVWEMVLFK